MTNLPAATSSAGMRLGLVTMSDDPERSPALRTYLAAAGLLLVGCVIGFIVRDRMNGKQKHPYTALREPGWEYVNPLLDCEQARNILQDDELRPIEQSIEDFIKHRLNRSWAREVTVYYRELNDGPWFAIGNTEKFRPASLLKVPLMISVLKQAETDPALLRKKVRFDDREIAALPNPVTKALQFGRTYTVEELLEQMIVYSDNIATYLLDNVVDLDILRQTYRDLGLPNPYSRLSSPPVVVAASDYMISAYDYAAFFRILYNASYLSKQMSDKALRLLTKTDFKTGLIAGVPPHIKVAHKWGTHLSGPNNETKQLHDCGIVYYPEHPYLLCIMTSGSSLEYLDDAIGAVSRAVYENIDKQHHR